MIVPHPQHLHMKFSTSWLGLTAFFCFPSPLFFSLSFFCWKINSSDLQVKNLPLFHPLLCNCWVLGWMPLPYAFLRHHFVYCLLSSWKIHSKVNLPLVRSVFTCLCSFSSRSANVRSCNASTVFTGFQTFIRMDILSLCTRMWCALLPKISI